MVVPCPPPSSHFQLSIEDPDLSGAFELFNLSHFLSHPSTLSGSLLYSQKSSIFNRFRTRRQKDTKVGGWRAPSFQVSSSPSLRPYFLISLLPAWLSRA